METGEERGVKEEADMMLAIQGDENGTDGIAQDGDGDSK